LVPRVLEVEKGKLCYVVGTVYMDMPLKPNVMIDIARDVRTLTYILGEVAITFAQQQSIPPPPPPSKFCSAEDNVMLEDESGRIRLIGDRVRDARLVTGVIIGALGMETPSGDFEVIDLCCAEMAPQPRTEESEEDEMDVDGVPILLIPSF
jgi:DNA polymerase delta subunit 2